MPLPVEFAELEHFRSWVLPTETERYAKRLASSMEEMQAFYDAAFPRHTEILDYLDQFPLRELPEPQRDLTYLMMSLINVTFPVEVWQQPRVPDSGAAALPRVAEPRI